MKSHKSTRTRHKRHRCYPGNRTQRARRRNLRRHLIRVAQSALPLIEGDLSN